MWHKIFMDIACNLKDGSKCAKTHVGCIIVKNNRIISSGVNGTPSGFINCCDKYPNGINTPELREEHHLWSKLHETHAEMNAILSAAKEGISIKDSYMFTTTIPCNECLKNMIQLGVKKIFFKDFYEYGNDTHTLTFLNEVSIDIYKYNKNGSFTKALLRSKGL